MYLNASNALLNKLNFDSNLVKTNFYDTFLFSVSHLLVQKKPLENPQTTMKAVKTTFVYTVDFITGCFDILFKTTASAIDRQWYSASDSVLNIQLIKLEHNSRALTGPCTR